jgi:hypothetical protein
MGHRYTKKHLESLREVLDEIAEIEKEFRRRKSELISKAVGFEVLLCSKCHRPMVPRVLWQMMPEEERFRRSVARRQNAEFCVTHHARHPRIGRLKDKLELERLRKLVAFDPNKDYDAEEEESA